MSTQRYTLEFKEEAVRQVAERGYPVPEVAARLEVSVHSLYKWVKAVMPAKDEKRKAMDCNANDLATITVVATRLRQALVVLSRKETPDHWTDFPGGTCGDTSLVLGAFLADAGFDGFELVNAERGSQGNGTYSSHAWLQLGQIVVDITADQFSDGPGPVVVGDSDWHGGFRVSSKDASDFREYRPKEVTKLRALYDYLKSQSGVDV